MWQPPVRRVKGCYHTLRLMLTSPFSQPGPLLTLTIVRAVLWRPFLVKPGDCDSHRQLGFSEVNQQGQHFSKQAGSPNYTESFWCSYNLDIMCYTPESWYPTDNVQQHREVTRKSKLLWILWLKPHSLSVQIISWPGSSHTPVLQKQASVCLQFIW